jgi:hypothetical protein
MLNRPASTPTASCAWARSKCCGVQILSARLAGPRNSTCCIRQLSRVTVPFCDLQVIRTVRQRRNCTMLLMVTERGRPQCRHFSRGTIREPTTMRTSNPHYWLRGTGHRVPTSGFTHALGPEWKVCIEASIERASVKYRTSAKPRRSQSRNSVAIRERYRSSHCAIRRAQG